MSQSIPVTNPLIGYQAYRDEIDQAIRRVLESGWYILGKETTAFEEEFASYCGVKLAVGVASGTDAIVLALWSLGVGQGDAVFTVSHTAVATVAAIEMTGATPVLIDINPHTYTLDPQKLKDSIRTFNQAGLRPRAVVGVHLYGHVFDIDAVQDICNHHQLLLIEDCAQAHGAMLRNQMAGSFGDAAAFSFYPTKNLAAFGDGGAVLFKDPEVTERCRAIREYGWRERYHSDIPGTNSRLDKLQAAILRVRLSHLQTEIDRRHKVAKIYDAGLAGIVVTPEVKTAVKHAYHLYVIRTLERDSLRDALTEQGVGTSIHYPLPVHKQVAYKHTLVGAGGLDVTEKLSLEIVSLPMHGFLCKKDTQKVTEAIRAWCDGMN